MLQVHIFQQCAPEENLPVGYTVFFFSVMVLSSLGVLFARFRGRGVLR